MNEEYAAEFDRCEEMDALARSNRARTGSPAKDKPKGNGLKRTTPLKAKTSLQTKTPLKAKTPLQSKPAEGDGSTWNGLKRNSTLQTKTPLKAKSPITSHRPEQSPAEAASSEQAPNIAGGKWNGLSRNTPLKAKSPMKHTPSRRRYGHLVKNGWCAVCGKAGETEWHHIIYRSHGGDEADENMLEVCRECHEKIHARLISPDEVAFARLTAGSYLEENRRVTTFGQHVG